MSGGLIFLIGPTACGKSVLALQLAKLVPCEIVSVDSMAVYRGMDIGTAKPDQNARQQVPHHLIDICDPSHNYSAAEFCEGARAAIQKISAAGKFAVLSGGTMFYFYALEYGLSPLPSDDPAIRDAIKQRLLDEGQGALHRWLQQLDMETAQRIHPNDTQRLQRAIEVCLLTGKKLSDAAPRKGLSYAGDIYHIAVSIADRETLHKRIEARFNNMLKDGICDELVGLIMHGEINAQCNAMRGVGYRQVWQYLSGVLDYQQMRQQAIYATCQLAKRQLTWMRQMPLLCHHYTDQNSIADIALQVEKTVSKG